LSFGDWRLISWVHDLMIMKSRWASQRGKEARAQAVSPQVESGNVYLPHPAIAPWVEAFVDELATFPNGKHEDQVDFPAAPCCCAGSRASVWLLVFFRNNFPERVI
jgi:phage terminase large subunit-like protein